MSGTWSTADTTTGSINQLPADVATSGAFYAESPDHAKVAFNTCCGWETPVEVANVDGTHVRKVSTAGLDGVGEQWSPDGSQLLYQQRDGSGNDLGNLYVQNLATGQRTRVTNFDHNQWGWWFTFPSFSPDGKSVLFQLPRGHQPNGDNRIWDLFSVPIAGGRTTLVQRNAAWGDYSPDGKQLVYLSSLREKDFTGAKLWVRNVHGGTPRALVSGGRLRWPRWSPDGTRIAYSDGSAVYVVDVATGKTNQITKQGGQPEWRNNHTLIFTTN